MAKQGAQRKPAAGRKGSAKPKGEKRASAVPVTSARACETRCPCKQLGEAFAELLGEPYADQQGVTAELGINYRVHMRWMAKEWEPGTDGEAYQMTVLAALDRQRRLDLENGQAQLDASHPAKAATQFNMFRFQHENRFRRFYGDAVQKVQLSGEDGGPIETSTKIQYVAALPPEEPDQEP